MNAMVRFGPLSVAFDASGCDNYKAGDVMTGRGTSVDHAVLCVGWKTVNGKIVFKGMNQWGTSWGDGGFFWIQEGAYSWGTEAIWMAKASIVPPPPPPPPPGPTPPPPVGLKTVTLGGSDGTSTTYQVVPAGAEVIYPDMPLPDFLNVLDRVMKRKR